MPTESTTLQSGSSWSVISARTKELLDTRVRLDRCCCVDNQFSPNGKEPCVSRADMPRNLIRMAMVPDNCTNGIVIRPKRIQQVLLTATSPEGAPPLCNSISECCH